mmetsp:Transcript_121327/g.387777  ORF Transcript_121327/g.387777 Transcript_121327/m.387777 type:complete len:802 (-) Transcript_121327:238-2643(-)
MPWNPFGRGADDDCCRCYVAVPSSEQPSPKCRSVSLGCTGVLAAGSALLAALVTAAVLDAQRKSGSLGTPGALAPMLLPSADFVERAKRTEYLFAELTFQEVRVVATFAADSLGCATGYRGSGAEALRGCFLSGSEAVVLQIPSKAAALAHLDGGGPAPPRFAEVIVVHGDKPVEQGVGVYAVGPLDGQGGLSKDATLSLLRSLHFNRRPVDLSDTSCDVVTVKVVQQLLDLLVESFGESLLVLGGTGVAPGTAGQLFTLYNPAVDSTLQKRVVRVVINWFHDPERFQVNWMHTLPFSFNIVQEGDPEKWYAENVSYCGQMFKTVDDLQKTNQSGQLFKCTYKPNTAYTWDNAGPDPGTPAASEEAEPGRKVSRTWHVVGRGAIRWRGWELFATIRPASGLALYDVRWRGERILYELSMSDAHAYYSGDKAEKQFHYSDKAFSLSGLSGDLVMGLDCPEGSSFLDGSLWMIPSGVTLSTDPAKAKAAKLACIFESDGFEGSLWRHAQLLTRRVSGRPSRQLVVRAVSTVGNYDYITEVRFTEDGSVHVRNEFAGYPETDHAAPFGEVPTTGRRAEHGRAGPWLDWGNRIRGDLVAQLHSHFVAWKVDLDILGQRNEFHALRVGVAEGSAPGVLAKKAQTDARMDAEDPDKLLIAQAVSPGLWRVVNAEALNPSTGAPRGYAIMIESAPAVQTLPASHPFAVTGSFAKRHLAVARRKDSEPSATHSLDHFPLDAPLLSVDRFLEDRESLVGEDLVCWVSIGKEHVTRSEDVPLVSNFGVAFALHPWNYHEENPAMQLPMMRG